MITKSVFAALMCSTVVVALNLGFITTAFAASTTVMWYKFNKGPSGAPVLSAVDSGPNHLKGTVTGPLTYGNIVPPRLGGPYSLNATGDYDYVTVTDNPLLDQTGNFTLSAWIMPTDVTSTEAPGESVVSKNIASGFGNCLASYGIYYTASTSQFSAVISGGLNTSTPCIGVSSADTFSSGQWHFVSMKYKFNTTSKAAILTLYVDGKIEGQQTVSGYPGIYYTGEAFLIGAANYGSGDHDYYRRNFYGYIDDVKLIIP